MGRKSIYDINKYINKKINKWKILSYSRIDKKGQQLWKCKCECGNIKEVRGSYIIRNLTKGCIQCRGFYTRNSNSPNWKGGKFISSKLLNSIIHRAKNKNLEFSITLKDLEKQWIKQNGKCIYSNINLTLPKTDRDISFNCSVDRKDSKKGYVKNNIQWVDKKINCMKWTMEEKEFINYCKLVAKNK